MRPLSFGMLAGSLSLLAGCGAQPKEARPRPPIDLAAPARVETATFALG